MVCRYERINKPTDKKGTHWIHIERISNQYRILNVNVGSDFDGFGDLNENYDKAVTSSEVTFMNYGVDWYEWKLMIRRMWNIGVSQHSNLGSVKYNISSVSSKPYKRM